MVGLACPLAELSFGDDLGFDLPFFIDKYTISDVYVVCSCFDSRHEL